MRKFRILTPYGDTYFIHDNSFIERGDGKNTPSENWKMIGVAPTHPFANHYEPHLATLEAIADGQEDACYKNGNPRYSIVDEDYGTTRIWGNSKAHGIKSVVRV